MADSNDRNRRARFFRFTAGCVIVSCACLAEAQTPLPMKSKMTASVTTLSPTASRSAPFVANRGPHWGEDSPTLLPLTPTRDSVISGSCTQDTETLCYDYRQGRVVYKPARKLMPEIQGLRRESLTLKRDKVTLNYSFK